MNFSSTMKDLTRTIRHNAPPILTALGVSGTVATAYLTGVATWKASHRLSEQPPKETKKELFLEVWDLYVPPVFTGVVTVGCIVGANHVSSKRMAAAYSVLAITEKGFAEYREQVVERLGERKEKEIRDDIARSKVESNPPGALVVVGAGTVLCCELYTGRYFNSDMESLRRAQNDINAQLNREMYATLNDFYYLVGLPATSHSGNVGWSSDRQLALEFTSMLSEGATPCLAFEYNYTKPL